jgi:lantibiotic biosynthesis protein
MAFRCRDDCPRASSAGMTSHEAWERRDTTLAVYHEILFPRRDPGTVLRTLLHP